MPLVFGRVKAKHAGNRRGLNPSRCRFHSELSSIYSLMLTMAVVVSCLVSEPTRAASLPSLRMQETIRGHRGFSWLIC